MEFDCERKFLSGFADFADAILKPPEKTLQFDSVPGEMVQVSISV